MTSLSSGNEDDADIARMDDQHQIIMMKFGALYEAVGRGERQASISALILDMFEFTLSHFADEEELITKTGYPRSQEHKDAQTRLYAQAVDSYREYMENPLVSPLEVLGFIKQWIEDHVLTMDTDYRDFMAAGENRPRDYRPSP